MGNGWGCVKRRKNISQLTSMLRIYTAGVVLFKKTFQALMTNAPYHLYRNAPRGACQ